MNFEKCERRTCFACSGSGHCLVLTKVYRNQPCPFYQTHDEVDEGRAKALKRLNDLGRSDLIQNYTMNAAGYRL